MKEDIKALLYRYCLSTPCKCCDIKQLCKKHRLDKGTVPYSCRKILYDWAKMFPCPEKEDV